MPITLAPSGASVIVFGPQGCGKSALAPALAAHFGCAGGVVDDASVDIYHQLDEPYAAQRFFARGVLVLTHLAPPADLAHVRRILHIREAARMAGLALPEGARP